MILTVDIGNTTTALTGLRRFDNDYNVVFSEKLPSDGDYDELPERVLGGISEVDSVVLSSVVPKHTETVLRALEKGTGKIPEAISVSSYCGVLDIAVPEPEKLGLDRIADSAWAAACYSLPAVTVDMGTATTFNIIDENRVFLGGIISAGLQTSLNALSEHTAQLPRLTLSSPEKLIGTSTAECMLSGAVIGAAAMIDGITARVEAEFGKSVTLILTGGGARFSEPFLLHSHIYEPHLLAKGLALAAEPVSVRKSSFFKRK